MRDFPRIKTCTHPFMFKGEYIACGFCLSCRSRTLADKQAKKLAVFAGVQRSRLARN